MFSDKQNAMFSVWVWYKIRNSANWALLRTYPLCSLFTGKQITMIRGSVTRSGCPTLSTFIKVSHVIQMIAFSVTAGRTAGIYFQARLGSAVHFLVQSDLISVHVY
jgi:hypothetical protein